MKFLDYLQDKIFIIILNIISMLLLLGYLILIGNTIAEVNLILIAWSVIFFAILFSMFLKRKKYLNKLLETCIGLDKKYLIAEIVKTPQIFDDVIYLEVLRLANKSMMEEIADIVQERKEYKEYIETWVHEIKTPVSAMILLCENNKSEANRKILSQIEKANNLIEQALFYAKSEDVEKDYLIKEINLSGIMKNSLSSNKQFLISNNISIEMDIKDTVFSDSKWIEFILNQIIINSVKYKATSLKFVSKSINRRVDFEIQDNGIGIDESDLSRIFDKGFVGKNGREIEKSTGIGLYICKRLCDNLGIGISIKSKIHEYTVCTLSFPKCGYIEMKD